MALRALNEITASMPGGMALVWDSDPSWLPGLDRDFRTGFFEAMSTVQGLALHFREPATTHFSGGTFRGWLHSPELPTGAAGELWRRGTLGWVPETGKGWSLPPLGHVPHGEMALLGALDEVVPGYLWGELLLPLGALSALDPHALSTTLESLQMDLERAFSLRIPEGGWPVALPFHRKRCGWRIGLLGGNEFNASNGSWEACSASLRALVNALESHLKVSVLVGPSEDRQIASLLGLQAMREGLPWRGSLALPPAPPCFSPGLGSDPRVSSPLEARAAFPVKLRGVLQHPPVALLRTPAVPSEAAVKAMLERLPALPALRWLPPEALVPGPFIPEHPWTPATDFPFPSDPTAGIQQALFDDLER